MPRRPTEKPPLLEPLERDGSGEAALLGRQAAFAKPKRIVEREKNNKAQWRRIVGCQGSTASERTRVRAGERLTSLLGVRRESLPRLTS